MMISNARWRVAAIATALALTACAAGCGKTSGDAAHERGAAVAAAEEDRGPARLSANDIARVSRMDLDAGIPISGTLEPAIVVHITSPLDEILDRVSVREGETVRKGQVLAQFRTASLEPAAASAEAEFKVRSTDHERMRNLLKEGAVAERDVEAAEAAWRVARAQRAQAVKNLEDATVRASVAGVIATRSVQGGDRVAIGDPLFQLVNTAELEFEATVPSEHVQHVKPGAIVSLTVTGYAGTVAGRVARINATADQATRQVKVYVTVPNRDHALVGGLFASGALVLQQAKGVLAVPTAAVRGEGAVRHVWTIAQGRFAQRQVAIGVRGEGRDRTEITRGLAAGDTVVVGPIEGLAAGAVAIVGGKE